ncbi:ribonuclease H-like domain-containing protein [Tanacetum coccineum]|uniref:Ribonuclease H-like domain-containing protein n=1 Tax=Tanacetum coccineum TaxID=301880 RepID=A0ABQ4WR29_9ASTR
MNEFHVTTTSPLPRSHTHALRDPNFHKAMLDEYNALITNGAWVIIPLPTNMNVVRSMWLSKHKFHADGSLMFSEIIERAHMHHCNPCRTPVDTHSKLRPDDDHVSDRTLYRNLALQYLMLVQIL